MDRKQLFFSLREAIVNQLHKTYKQIAEEHDVCIATVQQVAGILKTETGFSRPKGRPLGSGKGTDQGQRPVKINSIEENDKKGDMSLDEATAASLVGGAIRYDEPTDCVWIVNPAKAPGIVGVISRPNLPYLEWIEAPNTVRIVEGLKLEAYNDWSPAEPPGSGPEPKSIQ